MEENNVWDEQKVYMKSVGVLILINVFIGICLLLLLVILNDFSKKAVLLCTFLFIIVSCFCIPFILWNLYRYLYIKIHSKDYEMINVYFNTVQTSTFHRGKVSFCFQIAFMDAGEHEVSTRYIFSSFPIISLDVEKYQNHHVLVGYHKSRDEVVVIGVYKG